ncbi:hypothetical protein BDQ17DRAFT_1391226 [Cyathus striatus]|nr:hypothetical protein BDQ17DRAFT_1391226 [Cyathus striatus]
MHSRPNGGVSPLSIVLPHPPLPHRRSSLLSLNSASAPHTPRSCRSPCSSIFFATPNRKSTDSWNSSNGPDDLDLEWKPEQVLLLSRTLDALPAHLVTPFNGPIPPSNLLDKIARGVSEAKGPLDWPHSIRATRVKLIELSRLKAKEEALLEQQRRVIAEESEMDVDVGSSYSYFHDGTARPVTLKTVGVGARRPLYRQSSMDFMNAIGADVKNNKNITKLSDRLQHAERLLSSPAYHPYSRTRPQVQRRSSSPPRNSQVPSLINPSTPSSSTLNTISSLSSRKRVYRSSLSATSVSSAGASLPDPRIQRVRLSDPLCNVVPPVPPPKDVLSPVARGVKRAPSFGALAQDKKESAHTRDNSTVSCPSSDEEEKLRSQNAKKARTKPRMTTPPPSSPSVGTSPPSSPGELQSPPPIKEKSKPKKKSVSKEGGLMSSKSSATSKSNMIKEGDNKHFLKPRENTTKMNLQRNPSIFGAELPQLQSPPSSPVQKTRFPPPVVLSPAASIALAASPAMSLSPPDSVASGPPPTQKVKTLRRVRRLAPARRISFGSLVVPSDGADGDHEGDDEAAVTSGRNCLGSAFQLH